MLGICLGMHLFFERSSELGGSEGLGRRPRRGRASSRARRAEAAADRLERGPLGAAARRSSTGSRERAAYYHVHSFVAGPRRRRATCSAAPSTASASRSVVAHGSFLGVQFHPEKSSHDGLALLANWSSRAATAARDPLPGDRHPRRACRAARAGRLRPARPSTRADPLEAARAWAAAGARAAARRRPRRRARAARRSTSPRVARIVAETGPAGAARRRPALARRRSPPRSRPASQRVVLGTAAFADAALLERALADHGERVVVSVDVRGGMVATAGLDARPARSTRSPRSRELVARGVRRFVYTDVDRDGMLGGTRPRGGRARRRRGRGRAALLGRDRLARGPARRSPRCATRAWRA